MWLPINPFASGSAQRKTILKPSPFFRGELKLESHSDWPPLGVNSYFPTNTRDLFIWRSFNSSGFNLQDITSFSVYSVRFSRIS